MSKKILFFTLFLWLTAVIVPAFAHQKADTTYTFRFGKPPTKYNWIRLAAITKDYQGSRCYYIIG